MPTCATCSQPMTGLDEQANPACAAHATYHCDVDARPADGEHEINSYIRAMFAAHDARLLNPSLREGC